MTRIHLFIMRHGPSEESAPSGRDFNRTLSKSGRERTLAVARDLQRRGAGPARILTSPLVRTRETAAIVESTLPGSSVEVRDELAPGEGAEGLVRRLRPEQDERVLLVGHAPDVSLLAENLLGRRVASFAPAMVVALELSDARAVQRFVIDPERVTP